MKHLMEAANIAARKARQADRESERLAESIEATEKELARKQSELSELQLDKEHMQKMRSQRESEWQDAMKSLKDAFANQSRFKDSPSEEITRAFSDEILPDLDDL